jgi:hypothetical protein
LYRAYHAKTEPERTRSIFNRLFDWASAGCPLQPHGKETHQRSFLSRRDAVRGAKSQIVVRAITRTLFNFFLKSVAILGVGRQVLWLRIVGGPRLSSQPVPFAFRRKEHRQ